MKRALLAALAVPFLLVSAVSAEKGSASDRRPAPVASRPTPTSEPKKPQWVAVHRRTGLWSKADQRAELFRVVEPGTTFRLALPPNGPRLYVWDPTTKNYAWINAADIGPVGGRRAQPPKRTVERREEEEEPDRAPTENVIWSGTARVTMYTCVELGGCNATASGIWPYEGLVAVDPRLIPLGSHVWIEGLGTFMAADTGSAIKGARIDVYVTDYRRAINWGIQHLPVVAFVPGEDDGKAKRGR